MTAPETTAVCPLCESKLSKHVGTVAYDDIWRQLRDVWDARFSEAVVARHSPCKDAILLECRTCGLQYFDPPNAGDSAFYQELSSSAQYYAPEKWEFAVVRDTWSRDRTILDVGCGDGRFLEMLEGIAAYAVGLETNPEAIARAKKKGLSVELSFVEEFGALHPQSFDVVCSFHVLEHLPSLQSFVPGMLACVKPGGLLIVSVPNRLRTRDPAVDEPLDCPPHHISRWHPRQLSELSRLYSLEEVAIRFDPPTLTDCRNHVRVAVVRAFRGVARGRLRTPVSFLARAAGRFLFSALVYRLAVRASLLPRFGIFRQNMLAVLRKPTEAPTVNV